MIMNKKFNETEVLQLAQQARNEYCRIMADGGEYNLPFEELSDLNKQAWIMATDRIIELVLKGEAQ